MWGSSARPPDAITAWGAQLLLCGNEEPVAVPNRRGVDTTTSTPAARSVLITKLGEGLADEWLDRLHELAQTGEMTVAAAGIWMLARRDGVAVKAAKRENSREIDVCAFLDTLGAASSAEFIAYVRATSCAHPHEPFGEHDHDAECLQSPAAQLAEEVLTFLDDVGHDGQDVSVHRLRERAAGVDFVLQTDEDSRRALRPWAATAGSGPDPRSNSAAWA